MRLVRPLALGFVVWFLGCNSSQQNGQECLKNDDCESKRCIQYVCVDPASGKIESDAATEAASDSAGDATDSGTPGDSTSTDTGSAGDTGTSDTGASDTGTSDTGTADTGKTDAAKDAVTDADAAG